jgi:hypothetical protein
MAQKLPAARDQDLVEEVSAGSFPASDPPSWTAMHAGPPPAAWQLSAEHSHEQRAALRADVERLFAARARGSQGLAAVEDLIVSAMLEACHVVTREPVDSTTEMRNLECRLHAEQPSTCVVVAARYDREDESAVAMLLALLRFLCSAKTKRMLRLVALPSPSAGARYLERLRAMRQDVHAVVSIARLDLPRTRRRGGVLFVGDWRSSRAARSAREAFRSASRLPARAVWAPGWSFGGGLGRRAALGGFARPVLTVTDTRPWPLTSARRVEPDVDRMEVAVPGLAAALERLAGGRV